MFAELRRPGAFARIEPLMRQTLRLRGSRDKRCSVALPGCPSSIQTIVQAARGRRKRSPHESGYQWLGSPIVRRLGRRRDRAWRQERQQLLVSGQASSTDLGATMAPGQEGPNSGTCSRRTSERSRHISSVRWTRWSRRQRQSR